MTQTVSRVHFCHTSTKYQVHTNRPRSPRAKDANRHSHPVIYSEPNRAVWIENRYGKVLVYGGESKCLDSDVPIEALALGLRSGITAFRSTTGVQPYNSGAADCCFTSNSFKSSTVAVICLFNIAASLLNKCQLRSGWAMLVKADLWPLQ